MRQSPSEPERVLWCALRASQLGVQFRRQVVVAGFIVDFFAPSARLVVEVDGAHHARQRGADRRRDARLARLGFRVLRLEARLVLADSTGTVGRVLGTQIYRSQFASSAFKSLRTCGQRCRPHSTLSHCRLRQDLELSSASMRLATSARSSSAADASRKHASAACLASSFLPTSRRTPAKASCREASVGAAATAST